MLASLTLTDFRNFHKKQLKLSETVTVIVGPNATGKTNLLEAIYLLATGKSFRAKIEEEMINYEAEIAKVTGNDLEIFLTRGNGYPRKKMLVNKVPRRLLDFAGKIKVVLFGPWDMDLVTAAPTLRRHFLDSVLSQTDREYHRALLSYEKGLRQRNRLLLRIREENLSRSQLLFWDRLLIKNGDYISSQREKLINFINEFGKCQLEYDKSAISESRLEQYSEEEVAAATTLVGPHRDDFQFEYRNSKSEIRNMGTYGSRGEQRMAVLWLKMAELAYIEAATGEKPILLLDDIFSELDHEHREIVNEVCYRQQTVLTTADPHYVENFSKIEKVALGG